MSSATLSGGHKRYGASPPWAQPSPLPVHTGGHSAVCIPHTGQWVPSTHGTEPSSITGTWVGSYSCQQGRTGLRLTIENTQSGFSRPHLPSTICLTHHFPLAAASP